MERLSSFLIGGLVGAAAGVLVNYLFGPAQNTQYDRRYRSRLDYALEEGRKAAEEQEALLRQKFSEAKRLPKKTR